MHIKAALIAVVSTLQIGAVVAQSCASNLQSYQPAKAYCSLRYPAKSVTVTATVTPAPITVTVIATTTTTSVKSSTTSAKTSTTTAKTTTPASVGGSTKTITEIVDKTVTNCNPASFPTTCTFQRPTLGGASRVNKRETEDIAIEMQHEIEKRQFFGSNNPALAWLQVLWKGPAAVESTCQSCINAPAGTVTATVTGQASTVTITTTPAVKVVATTTPAATTTKRCITPKWCF